MIEKILDIFFSFLKVSLSKMMLVPEEHPKCKQHVQNYLKCTKERKIAKFFNACDKLRREMDICLSEEVLNKYIAFK